jgi:hypothetical protein
VGPLAVDRKIPSVSMPAVRTHFDVTPDIACHVAPEIAFDLVALIKKQANLDDVIIGKIVALQIERNPGLFQDLLGQIPANSIDIGQRHFHTLVSWEIYTRYTRHIFAPFKIKISNQFIAHTCTAIPVFVCVCCSRTERGPPLCVG